MYGGPARICLCKVQLVDQRMRLGMRCRLSTTISFMNMNGNSMRSFAFYGTGNPCAPVSPSARLPGVFISTYGGCDHATGQASFEAETPTKAAAVKVLGAAGLGLSLVGSASASTMPTAGIPQSDNTSPNQRFVLGEEEMADVSLATFHLFDRETLAAACS